MAKSSLVVLVAATLVLVLSAGDVDAEDPWAAEQILTFYLPPPATIIAGPGTGSTTMTDAAYGSLVVNDVPMLEGLDYTSKSYGQCRGASLVDSYDGTNSFFLYTLNFTSHAPSGSIILFGDYNIVPPEFSVPIIGGSGEFSGVKGYMAFQGEFPEGPLSTGQKLDSWFHVELHYTLSRP